MASDSISPKEIPLKWQLILATHPDEINASYIELINTLNDYLPLLNLMAKYRIKKREFLWQLSRDAYRRGVGGGPSTMSKREEKQGMTVLKNQLLQAHSNESSGREQTKVVKFFEDTFNRIKERQNDSQWMLKRRSTHAVYGSRGWAHWIGSGF